MGLFDLFSKKPDINEAVVDLGGKVLLDVREPDEFAAGHIPGSVNAPVSDIASAEKYIDGPDTPVYVYCLTGARSGRAVRFLRSRGYMNVTNIGGINSYRGRLEK